MGVYLIIVCVICCMQTKLIFSPCESWTKIHIPLNNFRCVFCGTCGLMCGFIYMHRLTLTGKDRQAQDDFEGSNIETFGFLIRHHQGASWTYVKYMFLKDIVL